MQLFRLLSAQPATDGESFVIRGAWHNDDWYTDAYGQNPAPFYRNPFLNPPNRPPYPWQPSIGTWPATVSMSPYYASLDLRIDTTASPTSIDIYGHVPYNVLQAGDAPQVPLQATTANTGGSILPGTYLLAFGASDDGPVSQHFVTAIVPVGTLTNTITVSGIVWGSAVSPTPYIGETSQRMRQCDFGDYTHSTPDAFGNPTSFTFTAISQMGLQPLPDVNFDSFLFLARDIRHGGDWGDAVSSVGSTTVTFLSAVWTTNQWFGYRISLYYRSTLASQPGFDYIVASNTSNTLTLTTTHALMAGDVVVMRSAAAHITTTTIGDNNFVNSYAPSGLTINAHVGDLIQVIAGTGAGQPPVTIASNTATVFTLSGPWTVTPDSTSTWIVTSAAYRYEFSTGSIKSAPPTSFSKKAGSIKTLNFQSGSLLIEALTVDPSGNLSIERYAPIREIYIPAQTLVSDGYFTITPSGGVAQIDLANGFKQRLVLNATPVTISAPIFTGGAITPNTPKLSLYLDQDATGGRDVTFTGGTGGFAANTYATMTGVTSTGSQVAIDGTPSTRTAMVFAFHGPWCLDTPSNTKISLT